METLGATTSIRAGKSFPYSLGKLIEWKHLSARYCQICHQRPIPYSLGKLIEWKLAAALNSLNGLKEFPTR